MYLFVPWASGPREPGSGGIRVDAVATESGCWINPGSPEAQRRPAGRRERSCGPPGARRRPRVGFIRFFIAYIKAFPGMAPQKLLNIITACNDTLLNRSWKFFTNLSWCKHESDLFFLIAQYKPLHNKYAVIVFIANFSGDRVLSF